MIDELDLLRAVFASDPQVPRPEVVASIKARVFASEDLVLLPVPAQGRAAASPAGRAGRRPLSPWRGRPSPQPGRSWRPAALAAGAVGLAAVVAAGVLLAVSGSPKPASAAPLTPVALTFGHGAPGSGAAVLEAAAEQVLRGPAATASLPVFYFQTTEWALNLTYTSPHGATPFLRDDVRQTWLNPDGSDYVKDSVQDVTRLGSDVGGLQQPPPGQPNVSGYYPPGKWMAVNNGLPTGVSALRTALTPQGSGPHDPEVGDEAASDTVRDAATPQLLASLYQVLAEVPDVFAAGQVTDDDGRSGIAIGFSGTLPGSPAGYMLTEYLVLDPTTGRPLEYEEVANPGSVLDAALGSGPVVDDYVTLDGSTYVAKAGHI